MKKLCLAAALLACTAITPVKADTIGGFSTTVNTSTLTLVTTPPPGNQPQNIQCLICGTNQPQQDPLFGYNNYQQTGNETAFKEFSDATPGGTQLAQDTLGTAYSQAFLLAFLAGQTFNVGIDVNTATGQGAENLLFFAMIDVFNHTILAQYIGPTPLPTANNGTGFPDYFLTGFDINRADINANSQIEFYAAWSNQSDGAESFFLTPAAAVPGPIVGAGIPGLIAAMMALFGINRARRRRNAI